jgi:hydroxymethylglutaryl-CoA lyase
MTICRVTVVEVGPRDGLQNEQARVSTADKIEFINRLSAAHLPVIEVSAFVSPKWVPQMADAAEVFAGIARAPGTRYTALVPNLAGLDRAMAAGVSEVAIFASSTETFSRKNINQGIDDSLATYRAVCERAIASGLRVRGYLSTAFGCPFEGEVDPQQVARVAGRLADLGVFEVAISDTIGIAHPGQVPRVLEAVLARALAIAPSDRFADMAGFAEALANIQIAPCAPTVLTQRSDETLNGMLTHVGLDGSLYRERPSAGPICSVNFGASGIAYALYRFACVRDDPRLLAAADAWIMKAQGEADSEFAFYNPAMEMTEATIGRVSLYHARPGVHLVHAILANARGEYGMRDAAARAYLASIDVPCLERDLTLGRSGTVLGCATLMEILSAESALLQDIRACGQRRLNDLWAETAAFDAVARGNSWPEHPRRLSVDRATW